MAKVTVICVVVSLTALLLERDTPELGLLLMLAAIAVVMGFALSYYQDVLDLLEGLLSQAGLDGKLFTPILKIIAISLVSKLGGDVCRDSSHKALASLVDMTGTFCALAAAQPLFSWALGLLKELGGMG